MMWVELGFGVVTGFMIMLFRDDGGGSGGNYFDIN